MANRNSKHIDYEYGYSGEIIVLVWGNFYCTVDSWEEFRQAKQEIYNNNMLSYLG